MDVKEILQKLGYTSLKDNGKEFRTKPLYRDSGNPTCLCVYKDSGYFVDYGREGELRGPLEHLVKLTLNLKSIKEAREWLGLKGEGNYNANSEINQRQLSIYQDKYFDEENLEFIKKEHSYWNNRNISSSTLKKFQCGVDDGIEGGKMQNRYVFPIFSTDQKFILGFSGRKLENESNRPKWLHRGAKNKWIYPSFLNDSILKEGREVILVESIGDMLSLWDAGIKNSLVTFGTSISDSLIYYLISIRPDKILIALNNDGDNKAGNRGAIKILKNLKYYFQEKDCKIALPFKNDFNDMTKSEILEWKNNA
jgi:hypothetical protein